MTATAASIACMEQMRVSQCVFCLQGDTGSDHVALWHAVAGYEERRRRGKGEAARFATLNCLDIRAIENILDTRRHIQGVSLRDCTGVWQLIEQKIHVALLVFDKVVILVPRFRPERTHVL